MASCDVVEPRTLRDCRIALGQSQATFAAMLGVSPESRSPLSGNGPCPHVRKRKSRVPGRHLSGLPAALTPLYVKTFL